MPTWRPACKVRLQVRFEDYLDLPPVPSVAGPAGAEAFGLGGEHPIGTGSFLSTGFDFVPDDCTVERNSFRKADTIKLTIPFSRLPFDPRIIRALSVQVFGGVYSTSEFAAALGPVNSTALVLPDVQPVGRRYAGYSNELFRGFADDIQRKGDGDGSQIEITGRDLTAILIDEEVPENAVRDIPGDLPLDIVIQQILLGDGIPDSPRRNGVPGARGLRVVNEATDPIAVDPLTGEVYAREPLPPATDFKGPQWLDSKRSAKKARKNPPGASHKISYWDLITDLCVSAGFICFIRSRIRSVPGASGAALPPPELVIARPRTYYAATSGTGGSIIVPSVRKLVVGYNVDDWSITKKFAGQKVPVVEVRSYDVVTGKQIAGRFPNVPDYKVKVKGGKKKNNRPTVSGQGDHQEVKVFVLDELNFGQGSTTVQVQDFLAECARSIREQIGREEINLKVQTRHLNGFEENWENGDEADWFFCQAGDPVTFEISMSDPTTGQMTADMMFEKQSLDARVLWFQQAGLPPSSAAAAAAASSSQKLQKEYRTQTISYSFSKSSGWSLSIEAINYLDVRDAADILG